MNFMLLTTEHAAVIISLSAQPNSKLYVAYYTAPKKIKFSSLILFLFLELLSKFTDIGNNICTYPYFPS
jgi:hypothetical protein